MESVLDNVKEETISLDNFPFICRICLRPGDLRPFKDEYLLNTFQNITKIDVPSLNFPRNVCEGCIKQLKDISLFIDIWKNGVESENVLIPKKEIELVETLEVGMSREDRECREDAFLWGSKICRFCSSPSGLTSFEGKNAFIRLFQDITNIIVEADIHSAEGNGICNSCIGKLEDISSFINLSLYNDEKLEFANGRNEPVKTESLSDVIDNNSELKNIDETEGKDHTLLGSIFSQKHGAINVRQDIFGSKNIAKKKFQCSYCEKSFDKNSRLKMHLPVHTGEKAFKCVYCEREFSQKSSMNKHLLIHTGEKPFKCDYCETKFRHRSSLTRHLNYHAGGEPFKCDSCEKSFSQKSGLTQHLRIHAGEKPFKCEHCEKCFTHSTTLQQHLMTHTGERPFICDRCGKDFNSRERLKQHLRIHFGEKPYKCDLCEKSFGQRPNLKQHMLIHTGEKLFKCDFCEKTFNRKQNLQYHLTVHTGDKPFVCDHCDRRFTQSTSLKIHLRTHSGEKPYKCDSCERSFSQKQSLQQHLRTHTGEKPYNCECCDKRFNDRSYLRRHLAHCVGTQSNTP